jgi:hypothetical protein
MNILLLIRDVAGTPEIAKLLENLSSSAANSDGSLLEDPVVLEIQLANALLYFDYKISSAFNLEVERKLKLKISKGLK